MTRFPAWVGGLFLVGLVAAVGAGWFLLSGFEPGGGGANQPPPVIEADGTVRIRLRLTVWGGGGPIRGRYDPVVMSFKPVGGAAFQRIPGRLVESDKSSELYEFLLSRKAYAVSGRIEYFFDVALDKHPTTIPGKLDVVVP
jgi:hypothetical protein